MNPPARSSRATAPRRRARPRRSRCRRRPRPPGARSPAPAPTRAACGRCRRGRSGRTRTAGRPPRSPARGRARQHAVLQPDLDEAPAGLHLWAFSSRFETARTIRSALPAHERRLEGRLEAHVAAAPRPLAPRPATTTSRRTSSVSPPPRRRAARELDHVAHERRQLVQLADDVPAQALLLVRGQALGFAQHLDVRAQRGDRRAQLVAGVGDQLPLGLAPSARARRASC